MPNRYIREDAIESEAVNSVGWMCEVFYRRLLNRVDDFGRFTANPALLRASIFPLRLDLVSEADIEKLKHECEQAGLIFRYTSGGKEYLIVNKWEKGRAKKSNYPDPPPDVCERMQTYVYRCSQMLPTPTPTPTPTPVPAPAPPSARETEAAQPCPEAPKSTESTPAVETEQRKPAYSYDFRVTDAKRYPLPKEFETPSIREAWVGWVDYLVGRFGPGGASTATLQQHIAALKEIGPPKAVEALRNAKDRNFRSPCLPLPNGGSGKSLPPQQSPKTPIN